MGIDFLIGFRYGKYVAKVFQVKQNCFHRLMLSKELGSVVENCLWIHT